MASMRISSNPAVSISDLNAEDHFLLVTGLRRDGNHVAQEPYHVVAVLLGLLPDAVSVDLAHRFLDSSDTGLQNRAHSHMPILRSPLEAIPSNTDAGSANLPARIMAAMT